MAGPIATKIAGKVAEKVVKDKVQEFQKDPQKAISNLLNRLSEQSQNSVTAPKNDPASQPISGMKPPPPKPGNNKGKAPDDPMSAVSNIVEGVVDLVKQKANFAGAPGNKSTPSGGGGGTSPAPQKAMTMKPNKP